MLRARGGLDDRQAEVDGIPKERSTMAKTPGDDERYLTFVRALLDSAKVVADEHGYKTDGVIVIVQVEQQGMTIASSMDSDDATRKLLAEAIARSHNVT